MPPQIPWACRAQIAFASVAYSRPLSESEIGKNNSGEWGANRDSIRATQSHSQPSSTQLNALPGDTRRRAAIVRRCLLSSGSRVRILPGAQAQRLSRTFGVVSGEPKWDPPAGLVSRRRAFVTLHARGRPGGDLFA